MDINSFKPHNYVSTFFKGAFLGLISMGIPGLSASTIAIVIGIYMLVVDAIANIYKNKRNVLFISIYIFGYMCGSALAAFTITIFFTNYPFVTTMIILGMIIGAFPDSIIKLKSGLKKPSCWILLAVLSFFLIAINYLLTANSQIEFPTNPDLIFLLKMTFIGLITSVTFIIPGVDFAIIFLALGMYYPFMGMLTNILSFGKDNYLQILIPNLEILIFYSIGYFVGVFFLSKLIKKIVYKYNDQSQYASFAFLLCAPFIVVKGCVFENESFFTTKGQIIAGIISCLVSFAVIVYLGIRAKKRQIDKLTNEIKEQ